MAHIRRRLATSKKIHTPNLNFRMNQIYIIVNPKFNKNSLINITNLSPKEINSGLNAKYANQKIENDFYKLTYVKEIDGDISNLTPQVELLFKNYKIPNSKFYNIKANLAIELLESKFFKKEISESELINWWNCLNDSWKHTFEKKIFPQTRSHEEGTNLHKITLKELRELLLIDKINVYKVQTMTLEPLRIFKELKILNFFIEEIPDLKPISELYKLEELNVVDTNTESLKPLSTLLNLKRLYCFGTNIKSIKEILHLTNLEIIKTDYSIPQNELRIIRENNPNCKIN